MKNCRRKKKTYGKKDKPIIHNAYKVGQTNYYYRMCVYFEVAAHTFYDVDKKIIKSKIC